MIVVDDEDRENEGDLIFAASKATPELMAFTIRHSSGVICVPMPAEMLDRLDLDAASALVLTMDDAQTVLADADVLLWHPARPAE